MPTNPYFNSYFAGNEQNLVENMIIESIKMRGLDVYYIPRNQDSMDYIFNEDPTNFFATYTQIEMWPASVEGMDGAELMTLFGSEFKKTAHFVVSKRRFKQAFKDYPNPKEGDLLYMPITNAFLQISFVENDSPYYELGKQYVWNLTVEAYEYSYESIETGNENVDEQLAKMVIPDPLADLEEFAKNVQIEEAADPAIDVDPANPFGVK